MHLEINPFYDVHTFRSCLIISSDFLLEWCSVRVTVTPLGVSPAPAVLENTAAFTASTGTPWLLESISTHWHSRCWIQQDTQNTAWLRKTASLQLWTQINQGESFSPACSSPAIPTLDGFEEYIKIVKTEELMISCSISSQHISAAALLPIIKSPLQVYHAYQCVICIIMFMTKHVRKATSYLERNQATLN